MSLIQVTRLHTLIGHQDCVYSLAPATQESIFFSAGGDGMVVRWDLNNPQEGELVARLPNSVYALHYHREKDLLIAGHNYEGIHVLDWQQKKEIGSLKLGPAAIFDIQSQGNILLVATGDGTVWVLTLEPLQVQYKLKLSEKSARVIALNPQRGEVAVGYSDYFIRIFSLTDFSLIHEFQAHQNSVFTLHYTRDFNYLISGSRDARLKAWDAAHYTQTAEVVAHLYAINHIALSPSGDHFATGSMDKSIKIWDTASLKLLKVIDKARHAGHGTSVNKVWWSTHQNRLVSASDDRSISVWDLQFPKA